MGRRWHEKFWVGVVLIAVSLLAYGWSEDPAANFMVTTVPFWVGVFVIVRSARVAVPRRNQ